MQLTRPRNKLELLQNLAISLLVFTCNLTETAYALPGQPLKNVLQWTQKHPVLPQLAPDQIVQSLYSGETNFENGRLFFSVSYLDSSNVVNEERIAYNPSNQEFKFTRTNPKAWRLMQKIYNNAVVDDFRRSEYVTRVGTIEFFRGRNYIYMIDIEYPGGLTLARRQDLAEKIRQTRACQPYGCDI